MNAEESTKCETNDVDNRGRVQSRQLALNSQLVEYRTDTVTQPLLPSNLFVVCCSSLGLFRTQEDQ